MSSETVQTAIGGSYYSTTPINPKIHLFPSAVERVFNLLDALTAPDHVYVQGEKQPSPDTIQWAKDVLLRVLPSYFFEDGRDRCLPGRNPRYMGARHETSSRFRAI